MTTDPTHQDRPLGLAGATLVGIGAILGGGIFVLAGVAFSAAGPGAILAFAANGFIAVLTALSFAEMSTAFPQSGGGYNFGKRVLSVRAAFAIGWILWFASIVAAVLYALGFASYALVLLDATLPADWMPASVVGTRVAKVLLAMFGVSVYTAAMAYRTGGVGVMASVGKVVLFVLLVGIGLTVLVGEGKPALDRGLVPFLPSGLTGVLVAMGFTFIAVQGFDLIAAVAGEVRDPQRNIPRAMLLSLGLSLAIYIPLLLVVATVGVPEGSDIQTMSRAEPATVMATAAQQYIGRSGFWLVTVAAVLSTLSALHANLLAASRVAQAMARDRTLPRFLSRPHKTRATPVAAILATGVLTFILIVALPNLAAAGAAASLIFLISFALAHVTCILARMRGGTPEGAFRTPWFPAVPVIGGVSCLALAIFQAVAVPSAGMIAGAWLLAGALLYSWQFATRAEAVDAQAEAQDPDLVRLRGRTPLVLVPIVNPTTAPALVAVANALATPQVGRVLMLTVVSSAPDQVSEGSTLDLSSAQLTQANAIHRSLAGGNNPEALLTVAPNPWLEIGRVARIHRCESMLLGFNSLQEPEPGGDLEKLLATSQCDVSILSTRPDWHLDKVRRVLVPIAGRGGQDVLRARLLGSLARGYCRQVEFLRVLPTTASQGELLEARRSLAWICEDEAPLLGKHEVILSDDVLGALSERASEADLVIMGIQRHSKNRKVFGEVLFQVEKETPGATLMISGRGTAAWIRGG